MNKGYDWWKSKKVDWWESSLMRKLGWWYHGEVEWLILSCFGVLIFDYRQTDIWTNEQMDIGDGRVALTTD